MWRYMDNGTYSYKTVIKFWEYPHSPISNIPKWFQDFLMSFVMSFWYIVFIYREIITKIGRFYTLKKYK